MKYKITAFTAAKSTDTNANGRSPNPGESSATMKLVTALHGRVRMKPIENAVSETIDVGLFGFIATIPQSTATITK